MDAALAEVVDSALRSLHTTSQRHQPCPKVLLEGLPWTHRQETLVWLLQAFDVMNFPDSLLFDAALLLDRYYATLPREEGSGSAQRKLLAAVCTALKTSYPAELQLPLRQVVTHLGRDQVPFERVMNAELSMLKVLRFHVSTPTARDFLDAMTTRLGDAPGSQAWRSLAEFLLQLTLVDASLHFRFAHAVLAASVASLALWTLRAPPAAFDALLEDFALSGAEPAGSTATVVQCMGQVHEQWSASVNGSPDQCLFARHLCVKFSRANHHSVAALPPPAALPAHLPPPRGVAEHHGVGRVVATARARAHAQERSSGTPLQDRRLQRAASWAGHRSTARAGPARVGGASPC